MNRILQHQIDNQVHLTKLTVYRSNRRRTHSQELPQITIEGEVGDGEKDQTESPMLPIDPLELEMYEKNRQEFGNILKNLKLKHPTSDLATLQKEAEYEMLLKAKKSRAFYRFQILFKFILKINFINFSDQNPSWSKYDRKWRAD